MNRPLCVLTILITLTCSTVRAQDTFSIVAIDTVTGEVGSAGASCIDSCIIISDVHPGIGAAHTQALWNPNNQFYAGVMMDEGSSPQEILGVLKAEDADGTPGIRQYGIVEFNANPHAASFTGDSCLDYKGHITGPTYSIQGNILKGREILENIESRFLAASGSLSNRLMAALQGANLPGADTRCLANGTSSKSSFLRVARHDDDPLHLSLDLRVIRTKNGIEPIDSLQHAYDIWIASHAEVRSNAAQVPLITVRTNGNRIFVHIANAAGVTRFELWNIAGKRVLACEMANGEASQTIDISSLHSGVYFY